MKRLLLGLAVMLVVALALLWVNNRNSEDPVEVTLREIPSANGRQLEVRISNRHLRPVVICDLGLQSGTNRLKSLMGVCIPPVVDLSRGTAYTNSIPVSEDATNVRVCVEYFDTPIPFVIARQIDQIFHWPAAANRVARLGESAGPIPSRRAWATLSPGPIPPPASGSLHPPDP